MNRWLCFIVSALLVFYGCSTDKKIKIDTLSRIDVSIEQSGNTINITNDTAEIRRTKFSIKFKLARQDSLLVNASFHAETFNNAEEGLPLIELIGFKNTGIAEEPFNKDSVIYISNDSPNFWYYADDTDHRFNNVLKNENGYICTREISDIINLDDQSERTEISRVKQDELFLVFIKSEWNEDYTRMIEKGRKIIKLKFIL